MSRVKGFIVAGFALVILAFGLMALVKTFLPVLVVIGVMAGIYSFIFKKRW